MGIGSYLRGRAQGNMLPSQGRSALVAQLLQQSMQPNPGSMSPVESLNIAAKPILAALLSKQEDKARTTQNQALAGALSRAQLPGVQGEAARRASSIIAGGSPDSPLAQSVLGMQAESTFAPQRMNMIGSASPDAYEPASVQRFSETGNYADLKPRFNQFGKYNPGQYTPESWAQFIATGDPSALVQRADFRFQQTPSGALVAGNTITGEVSPTSVTPQVATDEAATRKRAEAQAAAEGEAAGKAQGAILSRAMSAEGIDSILDIAEPLIDEATGSGTGASRDKLAAFFGVSTTGAQAIAQLLPLQAAIMLRQPRMEGPQSDRDVQLYREAAGQLGDPAVPGATKKAAIQTIRRLQQQYKNDAAGSGSGGSPAGMDFSKMSDEELQGLINGQ